MNYTGYALQYEIIRCLPDIYKHLKIGSLTLFQNNKGGDGGDFCGIGGLFGSLVSGLGNKIGEVTQGRDSVAVSAAETANEAEAGE